MLIDIVKKGSTDRSVLLRVIDSTDGTPETAVAYNTAGVDLWYRREGATKTSITEATLATTDAAHSDGGFIHVGDGYCRLDLPDAAFATGANYVDVGGTFTGMIVIGGRVRLVAVDLEDGVRGGMTALPNAAADAAGGLPISDAGGLDMDSISARLPAALVGGRIDATVDGTGMEAGAVTAIFTTAVTEAYRADGAAPTLAQAMCEILGHLGESSISGTTKTVKQFDGTTTAATYTLNDATTPTSITRAT